MLAEPLSLGIDLGTGGVRAVAATAEGRVVAKANMPLDLAEMPATGSFEQNPETWWMAVCRSVTDLARNLRLAGSSIAQIQGICVDGTSGTLVALDRRARPVRPAILYNDRRATAEADQLTDFAQRWCDCVGYRFESSFALAKVMWMARHEPAHYERTTRFLHQADFIVGHLTGDFAVTDSSNALKTGYDQASECWPPWVDQLPGVADRLPRVVAPGTFVGEISALAAEETGLPAGLPVIAGATDGMAAAIASGLRAPGDYNTTLGTTLVFKGISPNRVRHPHGLLYAHKLPGGLWLPGAASNTGAAWIGAWFPAARPAELDRAVIDDLPSRVAAYPLVGRGERFPFRCPDALGFSLPEPLGAHDRYAAFLTGTALVERLGYEVLDAACGKSSGAVYSTGGASASDIWMQCRADITRRVLHRPRVAESAFGSAILAAAGTLFGSLDDALDAMTHVERSFMPTVSTAEVSEEIYGRFREELWRRGYLARDANKKAPPG